MTHRVLVDTNVYISYLLAPDREGAVADTIRMILSSWRVIVPSELIDELLDVYERKTFLRRNITEDEFHAFLEWITVVGKAPISLTAPPDSRSRDSKDDYLLAYALVERVDYLVTGDKDLLALGRVEGVQIINPVEFLRLVGG